MVLYHVSTNMSKLQIKSFENLNSRSVLLLLKYRDNLKADNHDMIMIMIMIINIRKDERAATESNLGD